MLIDSHCHFDFEPFSSDPAYYLELARKAGVGKIIIPSVGERNWQAVRTLSQQFDNLYYALGLHPFFSQEHSPDALALLKAQLEEVIGGEGNKDVNCVAVGECGLDFAIADVNRDRQVELLEAQLKLASDYGLPVILHCRKAFSELLGILKRNPPVAGGVYHGFSGSLSQAEQLIDLGIKIGVGGTITYRRANKTRITIAALPLAALMLETDAPDMPVAGFQGQPNRPDRLRNVMQSLVDIREESEAEIEEATSLTAAELFQLLM
ncbi:TatD family hydrolase [Photobacterium chitinilyticum]|uniref:TatD family deoxyribonuclease n=1 Tax=Photobacterium chitinilyticum TaxID=2485123 RepID=A0A3S3SX65_9GAMM|nr:TatD family hydrolase [Photobacterium chitinilyticum]RWX54132.1 TatD family deoxyribonuclease [Photobacterium chitinilyticum]